MADSSVVINTRMENRGIIKGVRDASREIAKISKAYDSTIASIRNQEIALSDLQRKYDALVEGEKIPASLSAMQTALRNVEREIRETEKANKNLFAQYEKAEEKLEFVRPMGGEEFEKAWQEVQRLDEQLSPVRDHLAESSARAEDLRQSIAGVKLTPETSAEAQLFADKIKLATDNLNKSHGEAASLEMDLRLATAEAERLGSTDAIGGIGQAAQTASQTAGDAFSKIGSMIGEIATGATDLARKIVSIGVSAAQGLGTLASYAARGAKNIGSIVLGLLGIRKHSKHAATGIGKLGNRLVRLAKNVFVFSLITSGLRSLRKGIIDLISTNDQMSASLNAIQVNLLTAFAPIWQYIQPGLITFLALVERGTAAIATFIATLFGQTYEQAKATAQALYEQIKAMQELGKEADKNRRKLAGFDKINQQAQETADTGLDFGAVTAPDFSWLDELREAIGDWYKIGDFLSDQFTDFLMNIDWGKIQAGAKNIATNIVDFINGFLDNPATWIATGIAIAQGLNTALIFLDTLLSGLYWETFGRNFGMMLNAIVSDFDWALLGKTMGDYVNAVFGFLLRAVETFNWANLGAKFALGLWSLTTTVNWDNISLTLSGGLNGALLALYTFLTSYNWGALGETLASSLNLMIATIRWADIGATIAALFNSAISFLYNAITTFKWSDVGAGLAAAINKLFNDIEWAQLGQTLSNFFKGVLDFIYTAISETNWYQVGKSIGDFFANIDWNSVFKKVGQVIGLTLGGIFSAIWAALGGDAKDVEKAFRGLYDWLEKNGETVGKVAIAVVALSAIFSGIMGVIISLATAIAAVNIVFSVFNPTILLIGASISALISAVILLAKNWETLKEIGVKVWSVLKDTIIGDAAKIGQGVITALQGIITFFSGTFTGNWKKAWEGLGTIVKGVINTILATVKGFFNIFIDLYNGLGKAIAAGLNFLIAGLNKIQIKMPDWLGGKQFGFNIPSVQYTNIPRLAKGGIVDSATVAMIGERGREAVVPLENNTEWMDTLADKVAGRLASAMSANTQQPVVNITASSNGGQLIRYLTFEIEAEKRRQGDSFSNALPQW